MDFENPMLEGAPLAQLNLKTVIMFNNIAYLNITFTTETETDYKINYFNQFCSDKLNIMLHETQYVNNNTYVKKGYDFKSRKFESRNR